jgi:LDH2 family malate/lactate/ureidoglycolate dehydrogenase
MARPGAGDQVRLDEAEALELMAGVAARLGMGPGDCEIVARHLVDDELRGAVGMSRIFIVADEVARHGPQRSEPITVSRESGITAVVDGGGHHGLVVAESATRLAIAKARKSGIAVVCARNHRYSGTLGYYTELVARNGMIGISVASGSFGSVAPYGAREGRLDTNPIAVGFPTMTEPIVWDIATSAISGSEVYRRLVTGEQLPPAVALDSRGEATRDPAEALAGAILPWGGHRGSGLAMVIRLLALLSGVAPFPADGGEFAFLVIVVDPSLFLPPGEFERGAAEFAAGIRATPPAPGFCAVRMPSDRSIQVRAERQRDGIEIDRAVYERLDSIRRSGPGG